MNKMLSVLVILNFYFKSCYPDENTAKLDVLLNALAENRLANGSMVISKNGSSEYQKELGFSFAGHGKQTSTVPGTRYRIGSVSKIFTAVLIFQLVEEKRLRLDTNLAAFFPDIPNASNITVETLLRHRSGLVNYTEDPEFNNLKYSPASSMELTDFISRTTPVFFPDTQSEYSNTNYFLLSLIIEKIYNKPLQAVLTERIFSKINLKNTYFEHASDSTLKNSKSYKYFNSQWLQQPESIASNHLGAGALVSTPADLVTFMDALFSDKLLKQGSLNSMTSFVGEYGMGIFSISYNNTDMAYGHEGRI